MVVVVVGIFIVLVHAFLAVKMIGEAVSPLRFLVFGISHQQSLLPGAPSGSRGHADGPSSADPLTLSTGSRHRPGPKPCGFHPDRCAWACSWACSGTRSSFIGHSYKPGGIAVKFPMSPWSIDPAGAAQACTRVHCAG